MATMASASLLRSYSNVFLISSRYSTSPPAGLGQLCRCMFASEHRGPPKVNFWDDTLHPSRWKDEHFVIVSLTDWGLLFYGGYRHFVKGKNEDKQKRVGNRSCYRKIYNKTEALVKLVHVQEWFIMYAFAENNMGE